jgi:hypothetical protein
MIQTGMAATRREKMGMAQLTGVDGKTSVAVAES